MIANVIYVTVHGWSSMSSRTQSALRQMIKRIAERTERETQVRSSRKPHHMMYAFRPRKRRAQA